MDFPMDKLEFGLYNCTELTAYSSILGRSLIAIILEGIILQEWTSTEQVRQVENKMTSQDVPCNKVNNPSKHQQYLSGDLLTTFIVLLLHTNSTNLFPLTFVYLVRT